MKGITERHTIMSRMARDTRKKWMVLKTLNILIK